MYKRQVCVCERERERVGNLVNLEIAYSFVFQELTKYLTSSETTEFNHELPHSNFEDDEWQ